MATKTAQQVQQESKARDAMLKSFRDMLTVKVTLPLGDTKFKEIHTNSFIWLPLLDEMDLANYEAIMEYVMPYIGSAARNNQKYIRNRWYVEGVNTTNDANGKFQMELTLNPIASDNKEYFKNISDWQNAVTENLILDEKHSLEGVAVSSSSSSSSNKSVASTSGNSTLKGGEGTFIDNKVKEIVGSETDPLKKAKLIHEHIRSKQHYSKYSCSNYSSAETCYKNITHLNCADMSRLTRAMMASAGLTATVVHCWHGVGHFWVVLTINGTKYVSDNASSSSSGRAFDYYWDPRSGTTKKATNGGHYDEVNGKNPSC